MTAARDRASTLLFFPAALLVVVVLASVTVDFARLHLAQRQADDLAAATANDAVTVGLDVDGLRSGEGYRLLPDRVREVAANRASAPHNPSAVAVDARLVDPRSVEVIVSTRLPLAFARAIPGAPSTVVVQARARATARLR